VTSEDWVRVGDAAQWVKGRGRRVDIDGAPIAVFWDGAAWTALDDTCPHMGASLADGRLFGNELQCSWHEWRYDRASGQCPLRPWAHVRVHEVRIDAGGVWIHRPEPLPQPGPPDAAPEDDPEWLKWDPDRYFKKK
jgi:nitrite reductase (NADH) small subunit/3-phenylpropionate/trans-cinnamate dioxygenase ferredoxin subunit